MIDGEEGWWWAMVEKGRRKGRGEKGETEERRSGGERMRRSRNDRKVVTHPDVTREDVDREKSREDRATKS